MREYGSRLWSTDAGRGSELAYLDRIREKLENLEALATAGILILAVLFVIWFLRRGRGSARRALAGNL